MNLRREFRSQLTRGAWQYATVESVSMGRATVRLATNGARLTNLPILGAAVAVGEKVVVDYSAEGPPTVRPYTIPGTELEEVVEPQEEKEPDPPEFIYAKLTVSDDEIANPTVQATWWAQPGFLYGSWLGQYAYTSNFYNTIPFDEVIVDTGNILGSTPTKGYIYPPHGSYYMSTTIAIDTHEVQDMGWCNLMSYINMGSNLGYNGYRRASRVGHHLIIQQAGTVKTWIWDIDDGGGIRVRAVLDGAGGNVYTSGQPSVPDTSKATYLTLAKKPGAYPIWEIYKIADIGPNKTNILYWSWNEYDYPGQ